MQWCDQVFFFFFYIEKILISMTQIGPTIPTAKQTAESGCQHAECVVVMMVTNPYLA